MPILPFSLALLQWPPTRQRADGAAPQRHGRRCGAKRPSTSRQRGGLTGVSPVSVGNRLISLLLGGDRIPGESVYRPKKALQGESRGRLSTRPLRSMKPAGWPPRTSQVSAARRPEISGPHLPTLTTAMRGGKSRSRSLDRPEARAPETTSHSRERRPAPAAARLATGGGFPVPRPPRSSGGWARRARSGRRFGRRPAAALLKQLLGQPKVAPLRHAGAAFRTDVLKNQHVVGPHIERGIVDPRLEVACEWKTT